jgi:mRNA-degrading endonuclease RelE of RelBE toxin-antitoxin system
MYRIEIHEGAEVELEDLRAYDRIRVLDEIEEQLTYEPTRITRRKKILEALEPPWDQLGPVWQLRVSDYRVFYDVFEREKLIIVRAIRKKPPHRTTDETL